MKEGTLHADTNYAPWSADWVPEASWVTSLWKGHKLSHSAYLELSAKLRDGHDRRKACVDAAVNYESATAHAEEKLEARKRITKKAKPFKPLSDKIQKWRAQYTVDGAIRGQSATQLYTYEVFLWKTPLMLTTNCWEYADFSDADKGWIEANCVDVHIDSPVWEEPASTQYASSQGVSPQSFTPVLPASDAPEHSPRHKRLR